MAGQLARRLAGDDLRPHACRAPNLRPPRRRVVQGVPARRRDAKGAGADDQVGLMVQQPPGVLEQVDDLQEARRIVGSRRDSQKVAVCSQSARV